MPATARPHALRELEHRTLGKKGQETFHSIALHDKPGHAVHIDEVLERQIPQRVKDGVLQILKVQERSDLKIAKLKKLILESQTIRNIFKIDEIEDREELDKIFRYVLSLITKTGKVAVPKQESYAKMKTIVQLDYLLRKEYYRDVAKILEQENLPEDIRLAGHNRLYLILLKKLREGRMTEVFRDVTAKDCPKLIIQNARSILITHYKELSSKYGKNLVRMRIEQIDKILGTKTEFPAKSREKSLAEKHLEELMQKREEAERRLTEIPKTSMPSARPGPRPIEVRRETIKPKGSVEVAVDKDGNIIVPEMPEDAKIKTKPPERKKETAKPTDRRTLQQLLQKTTSRQKELEAEIIRLNSEIKDSNMSQEDIKNLAQYVANVEIYTNGKVDVRKLLERKTGQRLAQMLQKYQSILWPENTKSKYVLKNVQYMPCSVVIPNGANRKYCVIFVTKNGETKLSMYYKSGSATDWRLLPLRGDIGTFDEHYFKSHSGEEALTLPNPIQKVLDGISPKEAFTEDEISEIIASLLRETITASEDMPQMQRKINDSIFVGAVMRKPLDPYDPANQPDANNPQESVINIWPDYSPMYGNFKKVVMVSRNKEFAWTFSVTSEGVFVCNIQKYLGNISKYGVSETPEITNDILAHVLLAPVREYSGQLLKQLKRLRDHVRKNGATNLEQTLNNVIAKYVEKDQQGHYANIHDVLVLHPVLASFQKPLQEIARRFKTEAPTPQTQPLQKPTTAKRSPSEIEDLFKPQPGEKEVHIDNKGNVLAGPRQEHGEVSPIIAAGQAPQNLPQSFKAMGYDFNYAGTVTGKYYAGYHRYIGEGFEILVHPRARRPVLIRSAKRTYSPRYGDVDKAFRKALPKLPPIIKEKIERPPVQRERRKIIEPPPIQEDSAPPVINEGTTSEKQGGRVARAITSVRERLGRKKDAKGTERPPVIEAGETEIRQRIIQSELPVVSVEQTRKNKLENDLFEYKTKRTQELKKKKYNPEFIDLFLTILDKEINEAVKSGEEVNKADLAYRVEREFEDKGTIYEEVQRYEPPFGMKEKDALEFVNKSQRINELENRMECSVGFDYITFFAEGIMQKPINFKAGSDTIYVITDQTICKYPDGLFQRWKSTIDQKYHELETPERIIGVAIYSAKRKRVTLYAVPEKAETKVERKEEPKKPFSKTP